MLLELPSLQFQPRFYTGGPERFHLPLFYDLAVLAKPGRIVTLGFGDGQAHFAFCQAVREHHFSCRCFALHRTGEPAEIANDEAWQGGATEAREWFGEISEFLTGSPTDAAARFSDGSIDLILLNDCDSGEAARAQLSAWTGKLSPQGIILVQGIDLEREHGVRDYWLELWRDHPAFEIHLGGGLGAVMPNASADSAPASLFSSATREPELTQTYKMLAETIDARARAAEAERESAALETRQIWLQFLLEDRWTAQDVMDEQARQLTGLQHRFEELRRDRAKAQMIMDAQQEQVKHWLGLSQRYKAEAKELKAKLKVTKEVLDNAKRACRRKRKCFQVTSEAKERKPLASKILRELQRIPRQLGLLTHPSVSAPDGNGKPRPEPVTPFDSYAAWIAEHEPDARALDSQRRASREMNARPKFSLLMPVHETPGRYLDEMLESIAAQTYDNWEVCVVDGGSAHPETVETLARWESRAPKLRIIRLPENLGIAENSNHALAASSGDFVVFVDHDDVLAPFALYQFAQAVAENGETDVLYSDEDRLGTDGKRHSPFFKPEWSPELLCSFMYMGHLQAYRRALAVELGGFRKEFDLSQDYDLALRATEVARSIRHVPHVLYHWREHPGSGSLGGKPEARKSNLAALGNAMRRRNLPAEIIEYPTANRARLTVLPWPRVSIIVPTDSPTRAQNCLRELPRKTEYPDLEIVLVTNSKLADTLGVLRPEGTAVQLVRYDKPFNFSEKCNLGAEAATGERLIFFNDDVEPIEPDWIQNLIEQLQNPEVGAVSPKLLYDTGKIQHAGIVMGVRGLAGTAFHQRSGDTTEYFNLAQSLRDVSVLSAACLAVRREEFLRLGGFDAVNTPIAHSDMDLCFRIREAGLRCVYTPFATLNHGGHTSIAVEENEQSVRARNKASVFLLKRWAGDTTHDPYFTDNMRDWLHVDSPTPIRMSGRNNPAPTGTAADLLFVSHDLSLSGAPMMLLHAAVWCQRHGFFVVVMSPEGGPLREKLEAANIPVIIDPLVASGHESFAQFARDFDCAVANTILGGPVVRPLHEAGVPVLWWLHEPASVGEHYLGEDHKLRAAFPFADDILVPSTQTASVYRAFTNRPVTCLRNAIPDLVEHYDMVGHAPSGPLRFLLLASVEPRKGQDIFVEAIASLPREVQQAAEFEIAGRVLDPDFGKMLVALSDNVQNFSIAGANDHAGAIERLRATDVFVCASRDEAMPTVTLLEAMSLGKAIITTAAGGAAEFASNGQNALVVSPENPAGMAEAIRSLIEDPALVRKLGKNARASYEKHFTMERFGAEFLARVRQALGQTASIS